jgi:oligosaccharide reducing-end xylanase
MGKLTKSKYRNVLREVGFSKQAIEDKINTTWDAVFIDPSTKFYFNVGEDMGYMVDTGNTDVRTEGQSYGMMMAVQMNRQDIFDRIWKWTDTYMRNHEGPFKGYFAWHCTLDGEKISEGPAPDGEEFFAMALFLASKRWGDKSESPFNYSEQAKELLSVCIHKGENDEEGDPMWDPSNYLIKFVPNCDFTDPSYHLPHFYECFAQWSDDKDRNFWKKATEASRQYIPKSVHPKTGMNPEYAHYDGTPNPVNGHGDFYSDAYRLAANVGLDSEWFGKRESYQTIIENLLTFFDGKELDDYMKYEIDGTEIKEPSLHPIGLLAANAMGTLALEQSELTDRMVKKFFNTPPRTGNRRYYDNGLYFFAVLALSGNYRYNWEK